MPMKTPAFWSDPQSLLAKCLVPLSWIYQAALGAERALTFAKRAPLPTIIIGNVIAGGSGKTPAAIAIAQLLIASGERPHFISRGYGGNIEGTHRVQDHDSAADVGDEALLLAAHAPIWVSKNRMAAALEAKQSGASCVILDDGLQHWRLRPDISFLVMDGGVGLGNGRLLPAGPLRETLTSALARVSASIFIGDDRHQLQEKLAAKPVFPAKIVATDIPSFQARYVAFSGIAYPEKFFTFAKQSGLTLIDTVSFSDHHPFSAFDLALLLERAQEQGAKLLTTEKDMMRIPLDLQPDIACLKIQLEFDQPQKILSLLSAALEKARA